ncbi:hypothetical protein CYY_004995 [Polysphondylium violaceum]|uniref:Uncharacterized protein n=1 Tax=Polysphondylium violaceum TaxID=133409 RepID=A0A8J4PVL7_9MYCE|nr:hypothetical protein CYY_004995 [Polysphondylium violaceum]
MGIKSSKLVKQAEEFSNTYKKRLPGGTASDICRPIVCLYLASESLQIFFDPDPALKIVGSTHEVFSTSLGFIRNILRIPKPRLGFNDLVRHFNFPNLLDLCTNLYKLYKEKHMAGIKSIQEKYPIDAPEYFCATFLIICEQNSKKIDTNKLLNFANIVKEHLLSAIESIKRTCYLQPNSPSQSQSPKLKSPCQSPSKSPIRNREILQPNSKSTSSPPSPLPNYPKTPLSPSSSSRLNTINNGNSSSTTKLNKKPPTSPIPFNPTANSNNNNVGDENFIPPLPLPPKNLTASTTSTPQTQQQPPPAQIDEIDKQEMKRVYNHDGNLTLNQEKELFTKERVQEYNAWKEKVMKENENSKKIANNSHLKRQSTLDSFFQKKRDRSSDDSTSGSNCDDCGKINTDLPVKKQKEDDTILDKLTTHLESPPQTQSQIQTPILPNPIPPSLSSDTQITSIASPSPTNITSPISKKTQQKRPTPPPPITRSSSNRNSNTPSNSNTNINIIYPTPTITTTTQNRKNNTISANTNFTTTHTTPHQSDRKQQQQQQQQVNSTILPNKNTLSPILSNNKSNDETDGDEYVITADTILSYADDIILPTLDQLDGSI